MSQKTLRLDDGRLVRHPDRIDAIIYQLYGWSHPCPGPCFPLVWRAYLSHLGF